jgi:stage IV sporulation protein FB
MNWLTRNGPALQVKVAEIELLPFGGQAKIEDFTGLDPDREIYIAITGPLFSFSLAGIFYFLHPLAGFNHSALLININVYLGIFNLLPALPLDGGRVLRALLSRVQGYKKATSHSAAVGKIIAAGLAVYGAWLFYERSQGINYIIISILLFWAANREGRFLAYAYMRYLVNKKSDLGKKGYLPCIQVIAQKDTLIKNILQSTRPSSYLLVMVVDEQHRIMGMLTEEELIEGIFAKGPRARLQDCRQV